MRLSNEQQRERHARNNSIPYSDVREHIFPPTPCGERMTIIEFIIVMSLPVLPLIAFLEVAGEVEA